MLAVQNTLALSPILPECTICFEITDIYSRPHKLDLINTISLFYLRIRSSLLQSYIDFSRRQKLHKTILFNNM